uniref:Uncharacterized protein n=1 Tax=Oryza brachyantha TaxID=4533 RepID=J3N6Z1_ORYBR
MACRGPENFDEKRVVWRPPSSRSAAPVGHPMRPGAGGRMPPRPSLAPLLRFLRLSVPRNPPSAAGRRTSSPA